MLSTGAHSIIEQVKALPGDQQLEVAEAIDRLTWARRWRLICERIEAGYGAGHNAVDDQIDAEVRAVRQEKPLSTRSSIRPS
ncbi:MAG: hypothetical protein IT449_03635 [Phycisphaerales bacterium]|nr:hypothetical protein [Phycisphaerales bacterium]